MALKASRAANIVLSLVAALAFTVMVLNPLSTNLNWFDGISLTAFLIDESIIHFVPVPGNDGECHDKLTHDLLPNCEYISRGLSVWIPPVTVTFNDAVFRGRNYSLEKGERTYRIMILGDSFTFGEGVGDDETYPALLEEALNRGRGDWSFEVFNIGTAGYGTDREYEYLGRYLRFSPDLIIVQTSSNDIIDCGQVITPLDPPFPLHDYMMALDYMMTLGKEERCACVWGALQGITILATQADATLLLYRILNNPFDDCFDSGRAPYYFQAGSYLLHRSYWISRVDPHPNRKGHRKMAEELLPVVRSIIKESRPEVLS